MTALPHELASLAQAIALGDGFQLLVVACAENEPSLRSGPRRGGEYRRARLARMPVTTISSSAPSDPEPDAA